MTRKVFTKLLGLFALLLVFHTAVMEFVFRQMLPAGPADTFHRLTREALLSGLIALAAALPVAAWVAFGITGRLRQVVEFAHRIAAGDLTARLRTQDDELSSMEAALNRTAEQLGQSFAEIENRRQELAAMLDSMQEAVVAVTAEGQVRWSNAVMQRIAGTQIRVGRPLVHSVRDPDLLACVKGALDTGELKSGRSSSLKPGRIFEINAAPLPSGGAIAVLHDVTRVEASERSRRDFIANVSHELRTPLTSIQGYVETLIETPTANPETARECVRHASAALLSCALDAEEPVDADLVETNERRMYRGGLAPWQARSVTTYIDANLSASLSCEELARLARLSVSYFARAFKCTFGYSPHVFLMRRRMERAQGLMLETNAPLAQIALDCGFADQAHLSRSFLRFTGERPASWRRARASGSVRGFG